MILIKKLSKSLATLFKKNYAISRHTRRHYIGYWLPTTYKNEFYITSHYDIGRIDHRPTVYMSHGVGEIVNKTSSLNSDYYLCWSESEYEFCKLHHKKAYLVGSIYNDKTQPSKRAPSCIVYIPQHVCKETLDKKGVDLNPNIDISSLKFSPPTKEELINIASKFGYTDLDVITSITEDTDPELYLGHNIIKSNRSNFQQHFNKCKKLYESAALIISDINGTFEIIASNYDIPILYRNYSINKISLIKNKIDTTPIDNCKQLIINALNHIQNEIISSYNIDENQNE